MMFSARATICCLVICLYIVVSKCKDEGYFKAPICERVECPTYTVVHSQQDFEIRSYNKARWVYSPTIRSNSYTEAARVGSKILTAYFNGENRDKMKVNTTYPIVVEFVPFAYRVYFFMPAVDKIYAPRPFTDDVAFSELPSFNYTKYAAVKRFDGLITDDVVSSEVDHLKKTLKSTPYQRAAATENFGVADYNSPHLNEVFLWFD